LVEGAVAWISYVLDVEHLDTGQLLARNLSTWQSRKHTLLMVALLSFACRLFGVCISPVEATSGCRSHRLAGHLVGSRDRLPMDAPRVKHKRHLTYGILGNYLGKVPKSCPKWGHRPVSAQRIPTHRHFASMHFGLFPFQTLLYLTPRDLEVLNIVSSQLTTGSLTPIRAIGANSSFQQAAAPYRSLGIALLSCTNMSSQPLLQTAPGKSM
jgi:hypothetical protein